jgi:hypothetical protein
VLVDFLRANAEVFAWSPSDMPGIPRRAKSFVLLGEENQRCISIAEGQELLQEIHSGACGHHAAP